MRIGYVSREFGPITGGGIGTYIANVTQYMAKRGHEVYLITNCFNQDNIHYLPYGVTLIPTQPVLPDRYHHTEWLQYADRVYQTLKQINKLDVIEFAEFGAEGFTTIRAKKLLNEFTESKLVVKLHTPSSMLMEIDEEKHRDYLTAINIYAEDYCVSNADIVTSPSNSLSAYFQQRLDIKSIYRSPYPLHIQNSHQARKFTDSQIRKVTFVGSVQVRKGVDCFIEAAKRVLEKEPDFIFEIYGRDTLTAPFRESYRNYLQKRIPPDCQAKIVFKGTVPYEKIPEIFSDTCFTVFPSRWENWPNVCLEAMSLGCVVIGGKHGGMSEMIEHGVSGYLVDPQDPAEIAYTILDQFRDRECLQQVSDAARSSIQHWCNVDAACAQIEDCYKVELIPKSWIADRDAKVSVVIPLYNQGQYIQETIESVKASTYKNIDIVVVNDGSTDSETNRIFNELEGVVKVYQQNGGLSSARNAGIKVCTGEFILPLDADDKIHPLYIQKAVQALTNNPELSYVACYTRYFQDWKFVQAVAGFIPELMLFMNTDSVNSSSLYKAEAINSVGGFDEELISYEDWSFNISLHERGFQGDVIPLPLFYYRRRYESMVFSVALPHRRELIQYMMFKHSQITTQYASSMVNYLLQLWKQAEIRLETVPNVHEMQGKIAQLESSELQLTHDVYELRKRIKAMESSKFWQLRLLWFKLKRKLRLTQEEP